MGVLLDVFLASDSELATLRPYAGGPAGRFATISSKGFNPVILARLEAILTQYQGDILALVDEAWDDERLLVYEWEDEWVYRFPERFSAALAQLPPEAVDSCVEAWTATEELRLSGADTAGGRDALRQWLSAVCEFARRGLSEGRSLCMWWSL